MHETTLHTRARLAAGAVAITIAALADPAAATQQMPPDDTYTIVGTPTIVRPGGTITFTGTNPEHLAADHDYNWAGDNDQGPGHDPVADDCLASNSPARLRILHGMSS